MTSAATTNDVLPDTTGAYGQETEHDKLERLSGSRSPAPHPTRQTRVEGVVYATLKEPFLFVLPSDE